MDAEAVAYLQSIRPEYWIGYCAFGSLGAPDLNPGADFLAVEESLASSRFLNITRDVDLPVYIWSVSNMDKMRKYLASGASGIIGDCVEDIADVVEPYRGRIPDAEYYYSGEDYPKRAVRTANTPETTERTRRVRRTRFSPSIAARAASSAARRPRRREPERSVCL